MGRAAATTACGGPPQLRLPSVLGAASQGHGRSFFQLDARVALSQPTAGDAFGGGSDFDDGGGFRGVRAGRGDVDLLGAGA